MLQSIKKEAKTMLQIGMPLVIGQLGMVAMGVADVIQVGSIPNKGAVSVAAAGVINTLYYSFAIVGIIAIAVVAPMISKAQAEKDTTKIQNLYCAVLKVAFYLGIATFLVNLIPIYFLEAFGQDPEVTVLAKPFGVLIALSAIPTYYFLAIRQLSDGFSKTQLAMKVAVIALFMNIGLNYLLINGHWGFPALGLLGSGFATLFSRTFMMVAMWLVVHKNAEFKPFLKKNTEVKDNLVPYILKIGLPAGLQGFFEIGVFAAALIIVGWHGTYQQAAHLIAMSMCSVTYMMVTGIASASGIRVGHFWGLHDRAGIQMAGKVALGLSGGFMFLVATLFIVFTQWFVGLYTNDVNVISVAIQLLIIGGLFQISDGLQATALGLLRGIADVNVPTFITIFSYWIIGLPIGYVLGEVYDMNAAGVWIGLTAGLTASALLLNRRFYRLVKRMNME